MIDHHTEISLNCYAGDEMTINVVHFPETFNRIEPSDYELDEFFQVEIGLGRTMLHLTFPTYEAVSNFAKALSRASELPTPVMQARGFAP